MPSDDPGPDGAAAPVDASDALPLGLARPLHRSVRRTTLRIGEVSRRAARFTHQVGAGLRGRPDAPGAFVGGLPGVRIPDGAWAVWRREEESATGPVALDPAMAAIAARYQQRRERRTGPEPTRGLPNVLRRGATTSGAGASAGPTGLARRSRPVETPVPRNEGHGLHVAQAGERPAVRRAARPAPAPDDAAARRIASPGGSTAGGRRPERRAGATSAPVPAAVPTGPAPTGAGASAAAAWAARLAAAFGGEGGSGTPPDGASAASSTSTSTTVPAFGERTGRPGAPRFGDRTDVVPDREVAEATGRVRAPWSRVGGLDPDARTATPVRRSAAAPATRVPAGPSEHGALAARRAARAARPPLPGPPARPARSGDAGDGGRRGGAAGPHSGGRDGARPSPLAPNDDAVRRASSPGAAAPAPRARRSAGGAAPTAPAPAPAPGASASRSPVAASSRVGTVPGADDGAAPRRSPIALAERPAPQRQAVRPSEDAAASPLRLAMADDALPRSLRRHPSSGTAPSFGRSPAWSPMHGVALLRAIATAPDAAPGGDHGVDAGRPGRRAGAVPDRIASPGAPHAAPEPSPAPAPPGGPGPSRDGRRLSRVGDAPASPAGAVRPSVAPPADRPPTGVVAASVGAGASSVRRTPTVRAASGAGRRVPRRRASSPIAAVARQVAAGSAGRTPGVGDGRSSAAPAAARVVALHRPLVRGVDTAPVIALRATGARSAAEARPSAGPLPASSAAGGTPAVATAAAGGAAAAWAARLAAAWGEGPEGVAPADLPGASRVDRLAAPGAAAATAGPARGAAPAPAAGRPPAPGDAAPAVRLHRAPVVVARLAGGLPRATPRHGVVMAPSPLGAVAAPARPGQAVASSNLARPATVSSTVEAFHRSSSSDAAPASVAAAAPAAAPRSRGAGTAPAAPTRTTRRATASPVRRGRAGIAPAALAGRTDAPAALPSYAPAPGAPPVLRATAPRRDAAPAAPAAVAPPRPGAPADPGIAPARPERNDEVARRSAPRHRPAHRRHDVADHLARAASRRGRSLPSSFVPLARLLGDAPVTVVHDDEARRALSRVGRPAATVGSTILLDRAPSDAPAMVERLAHELVHAAAPRSHPSPARLFDDPRRDDEERRAHTIGRLARSLGAEAVPGVLGPGGAPPVRLPVADPIGALAPTASGSRTGDDVGGAAAGGSPGRVGRATSAARTTLRRSPAAAASAGALAGAAAGSGVAAAARPAVRSGGSRSGGTVPRAADGASTVLRRAAPAGDGGAGSDATPSQGRVREPVTSRLDRVDELVALIEARVLAELERRGGRHRGWL